MNEPTNTHGGNPHDSSSDHDGRPGPDKLMGHDYDGIREYDNPTPGWWHAIFIGTIVFSIVYWGVVHMSSLREKLSLESRHANAVERMDQARFALLGELASDDETLMRLSTEAAAVDKGLAIFAANCAVCHGPNGGGIQNLGLNLTDEAGKNVRAPSDVYKTIAEGVVGTAMLGWEPVIGRDDSILAAAYVISLRGTNVEGGLPPEGEPMPAWNIPAQPPIEED